MPLHEWTDRGGWEGVHTLWLTELLRWIKPLLPAGYRAYIGSPPTLAIGAPTERPDVGVREWPEELASALPSPPGAGAGTAGAPDLEIAVAALESVPAIQVERKGRLIAAVELISPRNKDRPIARDTYLARYLGYLL